MTLHQVDASEIAEWSHDDQVDDGDPPKCLGCRATFAVEAGDESTPFCHDCAHRVVHEFAISVVQLRAAIESEAAAAREAQTEMHAIWKDERDQLVQEREVHRCLLEAAEMRCAKLVAQVDRLEAEVIDTTMLAKSIASVPLADARLESGLIEALAIASRSTGLSLSDLDRLYELRKLVAS